MTKIVKLSKGKVARVSDKDYRLTLVCSWHFKSHKESGYAIGRPYGKKYGLESMHRYLMGCTRGDGVEIDHRDMDGLNNTRKNMRRATHKQNRSHNRKYSNNKSGFLGVCLFTMSKTPKWRATIGVDGKQIHLGLFSSATEAAIARDAASKKHHGSFASLNFPD